MNEESSAIDLMKCKNCIFFENGICKERKEEVKSESSCSTFTENPLRDESTKDIKEFLMYIPQFNSYVVDIEKVSNYFSEKYKFLTISNSGKEKLYVYDGKIYSENGRALIKEEFEKLLGKYAKINPLNEVIAKIERKNYIPLEDFEKTKIDLIPLENGVYNLSDKKLEEHSFKNYFKTIIPVRYDCSAKCPTFIKFLNDSLYPEDIPVIQEWFGFNLYRIYLIKKALICVGIKDTGKTVLLDTLISFVGELNKTGLSLQKISSGSDFIRLSLKDKYSNVYDDLSSKDLQDGGNFKIATGGGFISAEEKFGGYYQFKSFAKQTFATNKIPPVKDNDDLAYFSRWIVLRFDNPPEKKDLFLKDKIKQEMSGILNWALEGLQRLLEQGEFSYKKTDEEIKYIMEMSGDFLKQFGEDALIKTDESISKEKMYKVYCLWANENNKPILSKEQLGRRLNKSISYLIAKTGAKERFWDNCSFKGKWIKISEELQKTLILDTLDTSKNITRKSPLLSPLDIIKNKASNPSNIDSNTLDTNGEGTI
jgi:putative DNA primase/helicase